MLIFLLQITVIN